MTVRFTPAAIAAVRDKRTWWTANRDRSPTLFLDELADIVIKLRAGGGREGQQYAVRAGRIVYRMLMPKTRNHVYYRVDEPTGDVEIVLVWNATAAAGPDL